MGMLDGKVALVTGAGSGIGEQMALKAAAEGAAVLCGDVNAESARATADRVEDLGGSADAIEVDVTDEAAVQRALQAAISELGGLDVIYNNAGVAGISWELTLGVNLGGVYHVLQHGAELLREQGGGAIVNTASIAGLVGLSRPHDREDPSAAGHAGRGTPKGGVAGLTRQLASAFGRSQQGGGEDALMDSGRAGYTASKFGVVGLTKQFAIAYGRHGVRINAVAPGYVYTPMTALLTGDEAEHAHAISLHPMGRLGRPEEIANAATFLVSEEASFITGVTLPVDGGFTAQ